MEVYVLEERDLVDGAWSDWRVHKPVVAFPLRDEEFFANKCSRTSTATYERRVRCYFATGEGIGAVKRQ